VRKGDLVWFRDGEWHRLEAAADSEMRFLILYAPGVFRTAWDDPSKASAWSPTGLDIDGRETAGDARERITIAARGQAMDNEIQRWAALILLIIGLGLVSYLLYVSFGPLHFRLHSIG
jgi:hypothetical protein